MNSYIETTSKEQTLLRELIEEEEELDLSNEMIPEYEIIVGPSMYIEFYLKKDQLITAQVGSMIYRDKEIQNEFGRAYGNRRKGFGSIWGQMFSNSPILFLNYYNPTSTKKIIGLGPEDSGSIEALFIKPNETWVMYHNPLICCTANVAISGRLKIDIIGGNFVAQKVMVNDNKRGAVWIFSYGNLRRIRMKKGDKIVTNNRHIVAYDDDAVKKTSKSSFKKIEGLVIEFEALKNTDLYLQSLHFTSVSSRVASALSKIGDKSEKLLDE